MEAYEIAGLVVVVSLLAGFVLPAVYSPPSGASPWGFIPLLGEKVVYNKSLPSSVDKLVVEVSNGAVKIKEGGSLVVVKILRGTTISWARQEPRYKLVVNKTTASLKVDNGAVVLEIPPDSLSVLQVKVHNGGVAGSARGLEDVGIAVDNGGISIVLQGISGDVFLRVQNGGMGAKLAFSPYGLPSKVNASVFNGGGSLEILAPKGTKVLVDASMQNGGVSVVVDGKPIGESIGFLKYVEPGYRSSSKRLSLHCKAVNGGFKVSVSRGL